MFQILRWKLSHLVTLEIHDEQSRYGPCSRGTFRMEGKTDYYKVIQWSHKKSGPEDFLWLGTEYISHVPSPSHRVLSERTAHHRLGKERNVEETSGIGSHLNHRSHSVTVQTILWLFTTFRVKLNCLKWQISHFICQHSFFHFMS